MSLPAMSFEDKFCISSNGGTGDDGYVHLKGAVSMVMFGLGLKMSLLDICWFGSFSPVRKWSPTSSDLCKAFTF